MLRVAVQSDNGKDGIILFVKSYKRDWLFRKKFVLTPLLDEAKTFEDYDLYDVIQEYGVMPTHDEKIEKLIAHNQFYIIAKHTRKGIEYYCSEREVYDKRLNRMIQMPEFTSDIEKAEFSKSLDNVNTTLIRIRQNSKEKITAHSVFLTIENDLNKPNIIFALTNKNSKKTQYLKSYNLNTKSSDNVQMCDYMDSALQVTYDEALKIYDDLHAKHKNFLVNLHIRKDGENIPAKDFVCKRESIRVGFKLSI